MIFSIFYRGEYCHLTHTYFIAIIWTGPGLADDAVLSICQFKRIFDEDDHI